MPVRSVSVRDFRCYDEALALLGNGLTVVSGPNGAGKTNLLEALYFGCTGRSCRTANDRELLRFGAPAARVTVTAAAADGEHELAVGFVPGEAKRMWFDGAKVERLLDVPQRPLLSVFLPDRLELVKGAPALRRAHLDQFVAALWPARQATRRAYSQALAQRNALISRIRAGRSGQEAMAPWDLQLARHGIALMADRQAAAAQLAQPFADLAGRLGLAETTIAYRPRSRAIDAEGLARELAERTAGDLERGYSGHGPHRDELALRRNGRDLRPFGSQGQQRLALLALLLAERQVLAGQREHVPVLLLDDVMSELDRDRRRALVNILRQDGQAVITATDLDHVPGAGDAGVSRVAVSGGRILQEALAA